MLSMATDCVCNPNPVISNFPPEQFLAQRRSMAVSVQLEIYSLQGKMLHFFQVHQLQDTLGAQFLIIDPEAMCQVRGDLIFLLAAKILTVRPLHQVVDSLLSFLC